MKTAKNYDWIEDFQAKERAELTKRHLALVALWIGIVCVMVLGMVGGCQKKAYAEVFTTEASYFTYKSCIKEGTSGICANGERLDDDKILCASWDFPLNSYVRVSCGEHSIVCKVADRGPARRLYRAGRRLDLSAAAFKALAGGKLDKGLLQVIVEGI